MNYLAHLFFSPENPRWMAGNFLADNMKLKEFRSLDPEFKRGVQIHRWIDELTDVHPIFKAHRRELYPSYGKYAGVVLDILYDHILYLNWSRIADEPFEVFESSVYESLRPLVPELPSRLSQYLHHFCEKQWLGVFRTEDGINRVLMRVNNKLAFPVDITTAMDEIKVHLDSWQEEQLIFLQQMQIDLNERVITLQNEEKR